MLFELHKILNRHAGLRVSSPRTETNPSQADGGLRAPESSQLRPASRPALAPLLPRCSRRPGPVTLLASRCSRPPAQLTLRFQLGRAAALGGHLEHLTPMQSPSGAGKAAASKRRWQGFARMRWLPAGSASALPAGLWAALRLCPQGGEAQAYIRSSSSKFGARRSFLSRSIGSLIAATIQSCAVVPLTPDPCGLTTDCS